MAASVETKQNHMKQIFCGCKGRKVWCNFSSKAQKYRCTGCGLLK